MEHGFALHVVLVAGTRMIAQGTDGLSKGILLEGVVRGEDMLSFVDIARTALERYPGLLDYVKSWVDPVLGTSKVLTTKKWFQEGHRIMGGKEESKGMWIPRHTADRKAYIWAPPPIIADVSLEECAKAIHKRMDAYHIFLTPQLYSPLWL
jgi:hypothetical protein